MTKADALNIIDASVLPAKAKMPIQAYEYPKWGGTVTAKPESLLNAAYAFLLRVQHNHDAELCFVSVTVCGVCREVDGHADSCFVPAMIAWVTED